MDIFSYNGAALVAMAGKNCVVLAADTRFGAGGTTISTQMQKLFQISDRLFVGFAGLATDIQTLDEKLRFRAELYKLREEREMEPAVFTKMLGNLLYSHRFGPWFVEPVVAGLDGNGNPYVNALDSIGAQEINTGFVMVGTCQPALYGVAESLYKPDMEWEDLFEVASQTLLAAADRDAYSGWGAVVHILTPQKHIVRHLKTRQD